MNYTYELHICYDNEDFTESFSEDITININELKKYLDKLYNIGYTDIWVSCNNNKKAYEDIYGVSESWFTVVLL